MIPTTKKEIEALGWDAPDVIIFSGDAFIDHPSFGTAVIARVLESKGYRVAVVPQPNWRDDLRDFKKLGAPKFFFGVTSGAMDSMVNHYTAAKRLRSNDAYTPEGRASYRPDYAVKVYSNILKEIYPDIPVVIGGIEASLRRLTHYDYWQDELKPSLLVDSKADYLIYGMGERPIVALAEAIRSGKSSEEIQKIPQLGYILDHRPDRDGITLASFEECKKNKFAFIDNFNIIEREANKLNAEFLVEPVGDSFVCLNPTYPPATEQEMDEIFALPFTKQPHPRYRGKTIPAYNMIKFSITTHRGCFGGCNFCTIAAHQGKFIQSRSEESIISEVEKLWELPDFKGNISDLGAPTVNMYKMGGKDKTMCSKCLRQSCLFPSMCHNLSHSHAPLLNLYKKVLNVQGIRHAYIGSGIRYDLFLNEKGFLDDTSAPYLRELITKHTSGRLKVAPEHTEERVLQVMAKPSFRLFERLRYEFDKITREEGLKYQLVPYFISAHPGCRMEDMEALSRNRYLKGLYMEQVQDFTPTPMTVSSVAFYTGIDPKTGKKIFVERNIQKKQRQKSFFFNK
ncbi:MAG: YgiQ family radical SAM protein [Bacteroidales bacterium]|nr:YgiQ family radical SAM protein [Bacteroidales bacterium]MDD3201747.1 YgiQ family radical SAM protein [Bacteroidales bacterium]